MVQELALAVCLSLCVFLELYALGRAGLADIVLLILLHYREVERERRVCGVRERGERVGKEACRPSCGYEKKRKLSETRSCCCRYLRVLILLEE